jgi:hypothetical protein
MEIGLRNFDPRQRNWYLCNASSGTIKRIRALLFFTTGQIGVTYSQKIVNENAVVGIDIEMPTIQDIVRNHGITPSTSIALTDQQGQLLAWKNGQISSYKPQISVRKDGSSGMPLLAEQDAPVLNQIRKILPLSQQNSANEKFFH